MNAFTRWIDRFCARHPRFGLPELMKYLIIGNAVVWIFSMIDRTGTIVSYLQLNPRMILQGQVWRLATWVLIPDSQGLWAVLFLYFYYFIGNAMERQWGQAKFSCYFFCGMILTILFAFVVYFITGINYSIGAEYIYLSMFFAFAVYYPDTQVLLFFFIPLKIKWLALVDAAFFVVSIIQYPMPTKLLPVLALLNFVLFCGGDLLRPFRISRVKQKAKTVNFKREAAKAKEAQERKGYRFKCGVCGRTDTDYPNLEFRYCSRCAGYHCFCQEHINNHIHFTE